MEKELDSLIQLKQASLETCTANVIPTATTAVPSTLATSLAPTAPLATTLPAATTSTSATSLTTVAAQPGDEARKLVKAMEYMSIQTIEINKLKEKITSLENDNRLNQIMHKEEVQKSTRLTERMKSLEKELTLKEPLGQVKEQLWANIIDSVNDIWPSIQVSFEQSDLVKEATEAIQRFKVELGDILEEATRIIHFLNSKNKYELQELDIADRTSTILEVKKVLTKRNLMMNLEDKCQTMQLDIYKFMVKFDVLRQKGLPNPLVINDKLMPQEDYNRRIREAEEDHASNSSMKGMPTRKVLYQTFENLFYLQHEVKHLFVNRPTFAKYTEADEIYRKMVNIKLPDVDIWEKLNDLL